MQNRRAHEVPPPSTLPGLSPLRMPLAAWGSRVCLPSGTDKVGKADTEGKRWERHGSAFSKLVGRWDAAGSPYFERMLHSLPAQLSPYGKMVFYGNANLPQAPRFVRRIGAILRITVFANL